MEAVHLTDELLQWLLNPADPALRAKTLSDLLDRPETDPEVLEAKSRIQEQPWAKATLKAFENGRVSKERFYQKYRGFSWSISHLSMIGLPGDHPVMQEGIDYLLDQTKQTSDLKPTGKSGKMFAGCDGCYWEHPIACLTSRLSAVMSRASQPQQDEAVRSRKACLKLFDPEHGINCTAMELSLLPGCMMAVPEVMRAVLAVPEAQRTKEEAGFLRQASALLKRRGLYRYVPEASNDWTKATIPLTSAAVRKEKETWLSEGKLEPRKAKSGWLKFSFPHSYNPDLLEVLLVLGEAGETRDDVIDGGLEQLLAKRDAQGRWKMEGGLNGKMWANLDEAGQPSPWITYRALLALKHFSLLTIE